MVELTNEQIERILNNYKAKRERENKYYHEVQKNNEEFKLKNRERAKTHYDKNKDKKKENYESNKLFLQSKSLFNYYRKRDNLEGFKEKHEEKYNLLVEKKIIQN
tara:strand:- start:336 stop:650 length:315 start_codon:yes stop_codon:yes gene_type:complete